MHSSLGSPDSPVYVSHTVPIGSYIKYLSIHDALFDPSTVSPPLPQVEENSRELAAHMELLIETNMHVVNTDHEDCKLVNTLLNKTPDRYIKTSTCAFRQN